MISPSQPTYFIADIAANHDGQLNRALDLISRAKTNKKFLERLTYIEENIEGKLHSQSKKKLEKYWKLAKINLNH